MFGKRILLILFIFSSGFAANAQDSNRVKLDLTIPLTDFPQNLTSPHRMPSMNQALEWSNSLYDLSFYGIDVLGDNLFIPKNKPASKFRKASNQAFKYGLSLGFSRYGSELPIPLGVWGHEEFHRTVLAINNIHSKNGNWIFHRWDGTVYGVADSTLNMLKNGHNNQLLYSYVAGVQYEIALNEKATLNSFYYQRTFNKNALLLYNAHYVYNYFKFATSPFSDSVKILAPPHESKIASERDYAGADLTAWAYDMFNPNKPYTDRDSFPNGEGVNRRIGFSQLSLEAQEYLIKQKKLSLLNFLNPAIFFIHRIRINPELAFQIFTQYVPTHFGNDIAVYVPVTYKKHNLLVNIHNYSNSSKKGYGIGLSLFQHQLNSKLTADVTAQFWSQPQSFYDNVKIKGVLLSVSTRYAFHKNLSGYFSLTGKTKGWVLGNPYLQSNVSAQLGIRYQLMK